MAKRIKVQTLRKINLIVGSCHVGTIDFEKEPYHNQLPPSSISFLPSPPSDKDIGSNLLNNDFDLNFYGTDSDSDSGTGPGPGDVKGDGDVDVDFQNQMEEWTARDDDILISAVKTLGLSSWGRVSHHWFNRTRSDSECKHRWESAHQEQIINDNQQQQQQQQQQYQLQHSNHHNIVMLKPTQTSPCDHFLTNRNDDHNRDDGYGYHTKKDNLIKASVKDERINKTNHVKSISLRKRRELEALEERRLFGKDRPEVEKQLIHRAYVTGQNKMEHIMRMNAAASKGEYGTTISFASVVTEMKNVKSSDVDQSLKSNSKSVRKLPRSVMEVGEKELLSPNRDNCGERHILSSSPTVISRNSHSSCRDLLNLKSSQLPVEQVIELERIRMAQIDCDKQQGRRDDDIHGNIHDEIISNDDDDDLSFTEFLSPPLKRPFPWLGMPSPTKSQYACPKPYFLFHSHHQT